MNERWKSFIEADKVDSEVQLIPLLAEWGNWPESEVSIDDAGDVWNGSRWLSAEEIEDFLTWESSRKGA